MKNYLTESFWGSGDMSLFYNGLRQAIDQVTPYGIFIADNLFTMHKNLSFLDDEKFMESFNRWTETKVEKAVIWRINVLVWAARSAMRLEGDFVECACYKGTSARIICDLLDFGKSDKQYYLYDLFEHAEDMSHHAMPEHGPDLFHKVKARFADCNNVHVTKGAVPEVLEQIAPAKIAFMHLDINNAEAEIGTLEKLFDSIVPGGIIVLDDYGWLAYRNQKEAEDPFFAARGYSVLELPTGQGLLIK